MANFTNFEALLQLAGTGSTGDLMTVLGVGNTTGGNDIIFSSGDRLDTEDNGAGAGFALNIDGSDAGGGAFAGGDINLNPGAGSGGGADGVVNVNGDLVVTGTVSLSNLIVGTGSPEGVEVAGVGTIFQRTDGDISTNSTAYLKVSGAGNTGWVPMGPPVFETYVASGSASFVTSRAVFDDPLALGVENLAVFWNGVYQREGGSDDYTVVFGGASATITFTSTPPPGDFITIRYLPE